MEREELETYVGRRRDGTIKAILRAKEDMCDDFLPEDISQMFRKVVLDQVNDMHNYYLDVMQTLADSNVVFNQRYLDMIDELHERLVP